MINSQQEAANHAKQRLGKLFNQLPSVHVSKTGDVFAGQDNSGVADAKEELFCVKGEPVKVKPSKKETEDVTK